VGAGPIGVVYSEYALSNPKARNLIRPMLRENDGTEMYITTPRGTNHAYDLYQAAVKDPSWFTDTQTLFDTRAYDPEKTIQEERAEGMPEALIEQEYLGVRGSALQRREGRGDGGLRARALGRLHLVGPGIH
jgi:phage terminase large subunit